LTSSRTTPSPATSIDFFGNILTGDLNFFLDNTLPGDLDFFNTILTGNPDFFTPPSPAATLSTSTRVLGG
jgi:hypothetical protein